jgi:hypothetical protein
MSYSRVAISLPLAAAFGIQIGFVCAQLAPVPWASPAQYQRLLKKAVPGTLTIDIDGVDFKSPKFSQHWKYGEVKTFDLTGSRELVITDYENRRWHQHGEPTFRFTLTRPMPPETAETLAARVARPVINGVPYPKATIIAELPAHRRERIGGSNGMLRFRHDGIDYVATDARASRSWRWSDIQTLGNPNVWEFRVTGWLEIVEFDLKKPLQRELFDRLWAYLYEKDLNLLPGKEIYQ